MSRIAAVILSLGFLMVGGTALAQDSMSKDKATKDSMTHDTMVKSESLRTYLDGRAAHDIKASAHSYYERSGGPDGSDSFPWDNSKD